MVTNLEHYKKEMLEHCDFAECWYCKEILGNTNKECLTVDCEDKNVKSDFYDWLMSEYKPPKSKLLQWEYDLIDIMEYCEVPTVNKQNIVEQLIFRGHFKNIGNVSFPDVLNNCEIVEEIK